MRPWQRECFDSIQGSKHWLINAPTASGKTAEIWWLMHDRLTKNPELRAIVSVPQTMIGINFAVGNPLICDDGSILPRTTFHNLCDPEIEGSLVSYLLDFIKQPASTVLPDRIALVSHATLVRAFQNNPKAFKNLLLIVDEAHHARDSEDDEDERNALGSVVAYAFENQKKNLWVGLTTATFFRSDRFDVVAEKYHEQFDRYDLPFDAFLATLKYLRSFNYNFHLCEKDYVEAVKNLFKDEVGKTIVFLPYRSSKWALGDKLSDDLMTVYKAIAKSDKPQIKYTDDGMTLVKRGRQWVKVVDLVDDRNKPLRDMRKALTKKAHDADADSMVDVIITLNMFHEGADWRWAEREIIIGPRNSPVAIIQIMGRLFRDAPGKESVRFEHILPRAKGVLDKDDLNTYLLSVVGIMLLETVLNPPDLDIEEEGTRTPSSSGVVRRPNPLLEAVNYDIAKATEITNGVIAAFAHRIEDEPSAENNREVFSEVVSSVLAEYDMEDTGISNQLWKRFQTKSIEVGIDGVDVANVNYSLVEEVNTLDWLRQLGGGVTTDILADIRRAFAESGEASAVKRFKEIVERYVTINNAPAATSKDEQARADGIWLGAKRTAKKGSIGYRWYPVLDALALELGWAGIFDARLDTINDESKAIAYAKSLFTKINAGDDLTKEESRWCEKMRGAKSGQAHRRWYPSLDEVAEAYGHFGFFDKGTQRKRTALLQAKKYFDFCEELGYIPATKGSGIEGIISKWFVTCRAAKFNPTSTKKRWYEEIDDMLADYTFDGSGYVFSENYDEIRRERQQLHYAKQFCDWLDSHDGRYPSQASNNIEEKRLHQWWNKTCIAKKGKGENTYYPVVEDYLMKRGYSLERDARTGEAYHLEKAKEYYNWCKKSGRKPSVSTNDDIEKTLARWMYSQRRAKRGTNNAVFYPNVEKFLKKHGFLLE